MARTYGELHPEASIIVLESSESVGGVWSSNRLYPLLKTNNLLGTYESPDFAMAPEEYGVKPDNHIPGQAVHAYLTAYAKHFDLFAMIRFGHQVNIISEQRNKGLGDWLLTVTSQSGTIKFTADKLVIAAGVTNFPNLPIIPGQQDFQAPIYHAKDFHKYQDLLNTANRVVVYGGAKSAWDGVYAYAAAGVAVDWVIRESGRGPCWMAPAFMEDGSKLEDVAITRLFTAFGPCWWTQNDGLGWLRWLLHSTVIGTLFVRWFWSSLEKKIFQANKFNIDPETQKLKPWSGVFWAGTSLSILNYNANIFDFVRSGRVRVHHGDIVSLTAQQVHLSNGETIDSADALHCSTGWKQEPAIKFDPPNLAAEMGLPVKPQKLSSKSDAARAAVLSKFPMLRRQPNITPRRSTLEENSADSNVSYKLYRYTVPPSHWEKRSICFMGAFLALGVPVSSQCQSIWISAYLHGELPRQEDLTDEKIEWETELQTWYHRLRTPAGCGTKHGDFTFDTVPFFDFLLGDLGLRTRRKSSWWKELTEPYRPTDYKGLIGEWTTLQGTETKNKYK